MPRGNGKGPQGRGSGMGGGKKQGSGGRGRGGGFGAGPDGYCICPSCRERIAHQRGTACVDMKCPQCGTSMTRE